MDKYQVNARLKFAVVDDRKAAALWAMGLATVANMPNDTVSPVNDFQGEPCLDITLTFTTVEDRNAAYDYLVSIKPQCPAGTLRKIIARFDEGGLDELESADVWGDYA